MTGLRDRAQEAAGSSVAVRPPATIADQIKSMEAQFSLAMPKGVEAAQLVRDALTALKMTPGLAECSPNSVLGALMNCAQLGLRPGVLGHAYLLPFYDSKSRGKKAQLVLGYQGLIELAHRSGRVSSLIARTVFEGDTFDVDYGLADSLIHKPAPNGVTRGKPTHYYAIAKFTTGGHAFLVFTHTDMEAYRDRFATAQNREGKVFGPWADHFEGMAHKTMVRQLAKWMPKSTEMATALSIDEGVRSTYDPTQDAASTTHHYVDVVTGELVDDETPPPPEGDGSE